MDAATEIEPVIYKDLQTRAWEVIRFIPDSRRCGDIDCKRLASYEIRRRGGNLGRREMKCGRHWLELCAHLGMKLVEPSEKE